MRTARKLCRLRIVLTAGNSHPKERQVPNEVAHQAPVNLPQCLAKKG